MEDTAFTQGEEITVHINLLPRFDLKYRETRGYASIWHENSQTINAPGTRCQIQVGFGVVVYGGLFKGVDLTWMVF